jgi:hypothetical protein
MRLTPEQVKQRAKIDGLLWHGTQEEWTRAIVAYADLQDVRESEESERLANASGGSFCPA